MKRKSIKFDELTHSRLMYIASILNMPLARFLRELTAQLFDVSSEFKKANVFYDSYGNTLRIEFSGKSILVTGSMPMPNEISDEVCDIAVATAVESEFNRRNEENVE